MATAVRLELGRLAQEAAALAGVVRGSLGPHGGQVLLTRPTGEVLLSRDGRRVLEALNVDSPTARIMIACISTHCNLFGDGAKTFIILLSDLLQQFEKLHKRDQGKYCSLKHISQFLVKIQTNILDYIMTQDLKKHFWSIFSGSDSDIRRNMELVLEPYFCGKVGSNRQMFLTHLTCDFYFKVTAGKNQTEALCLVNECFAELHTTVTGLPFSDSRILDGLLLHRDFAIYCPADGDKRCIIITEPIHSSVSELGIEVVITAKGQFKASETWITKRTETLLQHMQDNDIKVILSGVKQHDIVHHFAKNNGISIVDCLLTEEISLICKITGISTFKPSLDNVNREITQTAVAKFCQPFHLGTKRFVHIGFAKTSTIQLYCVILCGPVHGVTEQHASAFREAFKMLQQMFTAIHLPQNCASELENHPLLNKTQQHSSPRQLLFQEHNDWRKLQTNIKHLTPCGLNMEKHSASFSIVDENLLHSSSYNSSTIVMPSVDLMHGSKSSLFQKKDDDLVGCQTASLKPRFQKEKLQMTENELLEDNQPAFNTVDKNVQLQISTATCARLLKYEENDQRGNQNYSDSCIELGSVLPVGGLFEILLHYYLSNYAKQCQSSNTSIICSVLADVLLSIPKALCMTQKKNAFPQLCLQVTNALKSNQQLLPNQRLLESISCKYHLVASVLQCAAQLLSVDLIISIKRLPQKTEESDSEADG
ncbi:Bardet-Biedl syndrome 10 protein isoform X1 [Notechis scutatus]|uniref:Bardet-Biedl syndrome 10 protein isoform X1 n=2 Tax=Notechis scutatus TaxID=8663 RepID=A0A6J1UVB3_9SAUR|nr:Bardet-Biedl syndrome 10 protein isoform X1 [Notechis scutatus]